ncbi:MAG TPA: hypothetical protein VGJ20_01565 [Xanthobacteraceae bacterium]|jgi:hypothetical protein
MVATFATMLLLMGKTLAGGSERSSKGDLQLTSHFRFWHFSDVRPESGTLTKADLGRLF